MIESLQAQVAMLKTTVQELKDELVPQQEKIVQLQAENAQMVGALKLGMEYVYSCREEFPRNSQGEKQCDADQKRLEQALSTSAESSAKFLAERDAKMWGEPVAIALRVEHADGDYMDIEQTEHGEQVIVSGDNLYRKKEEDENDNQNYFSG